MYDQITIPKSLALSKLVYNTSILTFPLEFFLFGIAKLKIKHTTRIGLKLKGDLDLPDFEIRNNALN